MGGNDLTLASFLTFNKSKKKLPNAFICDYLLEKKNGKWVEGHKFRYAIQLWLATQETSIRFNF